jgi:hypothetical protein
MRQWRLSRRRQICGRCRAVIATDAPLLEVTGESWRKVRCQPCGEALFEEKAPEVIEDGDAPIGIESQKSLGFESVGEMARRSR